MTIEEYNECVNKYADSIFRFIMKNLRHVEDARDVVQCAYEKLWQKRGEVDPAGARSYLFTIAYHEMIDHVRRNKKIVRLSSTLENQESKYSDTKITNRTLNEALLILNDTQRSLVMLKDYEGYSYREIGEITGLTESQVKVYLHRARLLLRNYIVDTKNIL